MLSVTDAFIGRISYFAITSFQGFKREKVENQI